MGALALAIEEMFYGRALAGLALATIVVQLVVLGLAVRRHRPERRPLPLKWHVLAGALIAAVLVGMAVSVHAARAVMLGVFSTGISDASEKAMGLSRGMSGQMNAIPFGFSTILLALTLWFVGMAYTLSKPRADGRARSFPPAALVGVGVLPVLVGGIWWSVGTIKAFAVMANLPPEAKVPLLEHSLEAARAQLALTARVSMGAIPILAVIAVVLIVLRGRDAPPSTERSARLPLAVSVSALALAGLLVRGTRATAAENDLPWPPTTGSQYLWPGGPQTPNLVGPDAAERAPVVTLSRDELKLDGRPIVVDELESMLTTLSNNFHLLHPGEQFDEMALIEADRATPIARLTPVLRAVREAWYYRPMLAFTATERHDRPVLGKLERVVTTGARFKLAYVDDDPDEDPGDWKAAVSVRVRDFADYDALARRVVALRRAGKPVLVKVDRASR